MSSLEHLQPLHPLVLAQNLRLDQGCGASVVAEPLHQAEHIVDVAPVEDAAVNDIPTALVVAADKFVEVAMKAVPEPAQVLGTQHDIIPEVIGVAPDARADIDGYGGVGHNLHYADAAVPGYDVLVPAALLPGDGEQ